MTDLGRVIEEGVDAPLRRDRPSSPWLLAVVGFALGLGLGVFSTGPPPPAPTPTTLDDSIGEDEPLPSTPREDAGVSAEVVGFPDAVVAIGMTTGSSLDHLLWPHAGPLTVRPMAGGDAPKFDSSGLYVAMTERVAGEAGAILSMGRFNQINTLSTGVTSFAWHDGEPGVLGYTTEQDGAWRLYVVKSNFRSELVLEGPTPGGRLAAWGDWGFAFQTNVDEVTLLNADGVFKDVEAGVVRDSHPDGWLFLSAERPKLVTSGGGVLAIDVESQGGRLADAVFSPDASRVAFIGERGVDIVDPRAGESLFFAAPATTSGVWSSDSRFVVTTSSSGIFFHDTETSSTYRGLRGHVVLDVGIIELGAS